MSTASSTPEPRSSENHSSAPATAATPQQQQPQAEAGSNDDDDGQAQKPRLLIQKTHAAFVSKLYAMVADPKTDKLISWTEDGDCFQVTDPMELSREVLPSYFKHGNWQSFVRQLNMYGFHKVNDLAYGGIFGDAQIWMFKHECFIRGELKLLLRIKRRGPKSAQSPPTASAAAEANTVSPAAQTPTPAAATVARTVPKPQTPLDTTPTQQQQQDTRARARVESPAPEYINSTFYESMSDRLHMLEDLVYSLQRSNRMLYCENQSLRAAQMKCQDGFSGLMKFLEAAVVSPTAAELHNNDAGSKNSSRVAEAFKRLAGEVTPFMSHQHLPSPLISEPAANAGAAPAPALSNAPPYFPSPAGVAASAAGTMAATSFRTKCQSQSQSQYQHQHQHQQPVFEQTRQTTLPPIRHSHGSQPDYIPRVPSLSPPTRVGATLPSADSSLIYRSSADGAAMCSRSRKRRSISSSSSSGGGSEVGDHPALSPVPHIVLPPISGMIDGIARDEHPAKALPARWCPPCPAKASVQSLRETLPPAKKARAIE
ncbi:hypothetical protein GQ54DRAFT_295376 [Martensiomyces pterosporus]|nr:hypothetical protein GQ54DRAFT_295376 [Martensiomyces pterosporus]